jgi:hypothetical protein
MCFSIKIWPQYKLDNSSTWPRFKTFNPNVLQDLNNFILYLQVFFYLRSRPSLCSNPWSI